MKNLGNDFLPEYMPVNLTTAVSDNGLLPVRQQANIWTNAGILLIEA